MEGDWLLKRVMRDEQGRRETAQQRDGLRRSEAREALADAVARPSGRGAIDQRVLGWLVAAFLGGLLIGAAVLLGYAWVAVG
jgi:hypothetical protein